MNYFLSIDQSTSATKVLLYDADSRLLDRESVEHQQIYPRTGWVEHDLEAIWRNLLTVVGQLLGRHRDKVASLACVSLTNQRETIAVFERQTGKPLHNAIVWLCRRGSPICDSLEKQGKGEEVHRKTGLRLDPYFSASKLKWLIDEKPDIAAQLQRGDALIGTIDTYLIHRLTEGTVFATDHTNASRTLLYDIGELRWDDSLCAMFGVPMQALPEVRESSAHFGETTFDGLLPEPVPIHGVMGDSQASLFAQRCYQAGDAKVTFGTGSSVLLNMGNELRISEGALVSTIAWVWQGRPTYSFEGIINFSAASIAWLKDQVGLLKNSAESAELAASLEDNGGVYLVPAFAGLGAPHWKPDARAAIVGLTTAASRHHIARAALESIAYQLFDVLQIMREDAGVDLKGIQADGGPTQNPFLMQFTADIVGIELHASTVSDCSALGAMMAGMLGTKRCGSLEDLAALPRDAQVYAPQMAVETVQQNLNGWEAAVKRVL